jgi:hypothetical protein
MSRIKATVTLTPDQVVKVAGSAAAAALMGPIHPFPIIFGNILRPDIKNFGTAKAV